jgi:hypothetical protein
MDTLKKFNLEIRNARQMYVTAVLALTPAGQHTVFPIPGKKGAGLPEFQAAVDSGRYAHVALLNVTNVMATWHADDAQISKGNSRNFSLLQLLQISTGVLLRTGGSVDLYAVLDYVSGDQVYTNQLGRVADEFMPLLFEQHPFLKAIPKHLFSGKSQQVIDATLTRLRKRYGDCFKIYPMHPEDHKRLPPEVELYMQAPHLNVTHYNTTTGTFDESGGNES